MQASDVYCRLRDKKYTSRIGIEPTQTNLEGWSPSIRRPRQKKFESKDQ